MMQLISKQEVNDEKKGTASLDTLPIEQCLAAAAATQHPTTQLLLSSRLITHGPDAGLNPLVDAAAKLFSVMGKLKYLKSHDHLAGLHDELVLDIEHFQESVQTYPYQAEYIAEYLPIATYTLCVTLDDIIANTPWGNQGKWDDYLLLTVFSQERLSSKNFLIILERLVRDPAIYIDVMEFMYICLSLGFKCHLGPSEGDLEQLQQITHSLYKRIRTHRGNFSKTLAPFPIKPRSPAVSFSWKNVPFWLMGLLITALLVLCFTIGNYLLDWTFHRTANTMTQAERILNEKPHE